MFGFSLTKLLVLAAVIGGVIVAFRLFGRSLAGPRNAPRDERIYDAEYDSDSGAYVVREEDSENS